MFFVEKVVDHRTNAPVGSLIGDHEFQSRQNGNLYMLKRQIGNQREQEQQGGRKGREKIIGYRGAAITQVYVIHVLNKERTGFIQRYPLKARKYRPLGPGL